jgi:hypothetical protein
MTELQNMLKTINETKDREEQNRHIQVFLKMFMKQEHFYCVVAHKENIQEGRPFIGYFKNVPCFYVFTDSTIAVNFAKHYGLTSEKGESYVLKIKNLLETLINYQKLGIPLIMFDEGANCLCHNITYVIETMKEIENENKIIDTFIGINTETGENVVLSKQDRLRNTLIIGSIASGKVSLSILPMINQDLKEMKSSTTIVSSNIDVLDKVHIMGQYYGKSVMFLNFTKPELYEKKIAELTNEDLTNKNKIFLIYASDKNHDSKEASLFSVFSNKLLNSVSSKERKNKVLQSVYLIDTPFVSDYFENIILGHDLGVVITQSVQTLEELRTQSLFDLSDVIQSHHNLIVYPGISRHDEEMVKTRRIQSDKLLTLPFKEVAYCIGGESGFAKVNFIPSDKEKEFKEFAEKIKKRKSNITLEQLQLFDNVDKNVAVLMIDNQFVINGDIRIFLTSESHIKAWVEENLQDIGDKKVTLFTDRVGKVVDYVIQNKQVNGLFIEGLAPDSLYITHDDLQPLKALIDSFCILYACVNNKIDKDKTAELLKNKEVYFIGEFPSLEKSSFGFETMKRMENGREYESIKVFLTKEHADKYNPRNQPITKCQFYDLAFFFNEKYALIVEPHCNYWVEFTQKEILK